MRKMKDSGLSWIDEIPHTWETARVKYLFSSSKGLPITKENLIENGLSVISYGQIHAKSNNGVSVTQDLLRFVDFSYQLLYPKSQVFNGGFVFADTSEDLDGCGNCVYKRDNDLLFGGYHSIILHPNTTTDNRFLAYLFKTDAWRKQIRELVSGFKVFTISQRALLNASVILPPLDEQKHIADFLDKECEKIDELKADIQTQIDMLEQYKRSAITEALTHGLNHSAPMKDSGIACVGNYPSHWECEKGKYILKLLSKPIRQDDGVITCFRDGEVTLRSNRREEGFTMADKEIGYQGIDIGDLVVHGMDGFAGAIGISDSRGKASPVLNVLDTTQNKKYIMYYLRSMAYNDVFTALSTGIRVRSCDLRWNKLAELLYPLPPLDEQKAIADYLDHKCAEIEQIIADKNTQLDMLDEYKKSLIYEYVTGKKEAA